MPPSFISHAQNREDVVLWRALRHIEHGTYVEIGANDPDVDSISKAFYERGWRGVLVEPVPELADRLRAGRPEDVVVEAAIVAEDVSTVTLHSIPGTGLSTLSDDIVRGHQQRGWDVEDIEVRGKRLDNLLEQLGWEGRPLHFMTVDVEGAEIDVLRGVDLQRWRPWVLVVEATLPLTTTPNEEGWEPLILEAGYRFCLFDGLSRFYVAEEHADELAGKLAYPACVLDDFVPVNEHEAHARSERLRLECERQRDLVAQLSADLVMWRGQVLERWTEACALMRSQSTVDQSAAQRELDAMRSTLSWRVTRPLRAVRRATRSNP